MKKRRFTKTEKRILDYIEQARLEGNKTDYWSTFKMPWGWVANPHFWPSSKPEEKACEALVQAGILVEVNHKVFVKNHRAPKEA
jgi:hypothetical protein